MSSPFVWFHHNGEKSKEAAKFLESLLSWKASEGPAGMTMLATDDGPFAAVGSKPERYGDRNEWIRFVADAKSRPPVLRTARLVSFVMTPTRSLLPTRNGLDGLSTQASGLEGFVRALNARQAVA